MKCYVNTEGDIYFKFKDAKKFCEKGNIGLYRMSEMVLNGEMLGGGGADLQGPKEEVRA